MVGSMGQQTAERTARSDVVVRKEGGIESAISDETNPRSGGHGVTSPGSCFLARFSCFCCHSSTSPLYRFCGDATLLMRLDGISSSAEITSCVRNCGSCEVLVYGERRNCAAARRMGDDSEGSQEFDPEIWICCGTGEGAHRSS